MMVPVAALAAGGGGPLYDADVDLNNKASLQHGAKLYVNYCMGCHSLSYMRYNRMGQDIGLSDEQVAQNLMFVYDFSKLPKGEAPKMGSLMKNAMPGEAVASVRKMICPGRWTSQSRPSPAEARRPARRMPSIHSAST